MGRKYTFVTNDIGLIIRRKLVSPLGEPIDLTGAVVKIRWKQKRQPMQQRDADVMIPATNGIVEYVVQPGDFVPDELGLNFEWEVTLGPTQKLSSPDLDGPFYVREEVG